MKRIPVSAFAILVLTAGTALAVGIAPVRTSSSTVFLRNKESAKGPVFDYYFGSFDRSSPLVACHKNEALLIVNGGLHILNADSLDLQAVRGGEGFHWRQFWGIESAGDVVRIAEHFEDSEGPSLPSEFFRFSFSSHLFERATEGPDANGERLTQCELAGDRMLFIGEVGIRIRFWPKHLRALDEDCRREWAVSKKSSYGRRECRARSKDRDVLDEAQSLAEQDLRDLVMWVPGSERSAWEDYRRGGSNPPEIRERMRNLRSAYERLAAAIKEPNSGHLYPLESHSIFLSQLASSYPDYTLQSIQHLLDELENERQKPGIMWGVMKPVKK